MQLTDFSQINREYIYNTVNTKKSIITYPPKSVYLRCTAS